MSFDCMAIDIGASNGRVMDGKIDGGVMTLSEISRFPNRPISVNGELYWDVLYLYEQILQSFHIKASGGRGEKISIGMDTFGMDFGVLDKNGKLLGNPLSYRGERGQKGKRLFDEHRKKDLYWLTGIGDRPYNTSYQLYYMTQTKDPFLEAGDSLLFIPDLLAYFLTGNAFCDKSIASPGQVISLSETDWQQEVLELLEIRREKMPELRECGAYRGEILPDIASACGLPKGTDLAFSVHDTAAALEAIPSAEEQYAFISSGTWSLMGITSNVPKLNHLTHSCAFSNICTLDDRFMILKNIMGMWVLQCCKRDWELESGKTLTWDEVVLAVEEVQSHSYIDINDDLFFHDGNMVKRIQSFCESTGQPSPQIPAEAVRIVMESLAMSYRETFLELLELSENGIHSLHIVGGGSRNNLLNQMTANLTGCEVVAGPAEATVIGNVMRQAAQQGYLKPSQKIEILENSFAIRRFTPQDTSYWEEKWRRYEQIVGEYREKREARGEI